MADGFTKRQNGADGPRMQRPRASRTAGVGNYSPFDPFGTARLFSAMVGVPSDQRPLGGETYDAAKYLAQKSLEWTPEPLRGWFKQELLLNASLHTHMRSEDMASLFEYIGQQIEWIKVNRKIWGLSDKNSELFEHYNHQFLVEDAQGKIIPVSERQLLSLFPKADPVTGKMPEDFPQLVFTFSHARGEDLNDVTAITHGTAAMIHEATDGKCHFAKIDLTKPGLGVKPGDTLIVHRCDVRENPWLNGAALLRRLNELKRAKETGIDKMKYVSPGAWAVNHLMLAMMAEQPGVILNANGRPLSHYYAKGVNAALRDENALHGLELRQDAARVAQHFSLVGYSKGGTTASDAGPRLLTHELQARDTNGRDLFFVHHEHELRPITQHGIVGERGIHDVRNLVRQVTCWAEAAVEYGLTDAQIAAGARRVAFNNKHDMISAHSNYTGRKHDERWIIEGDTGKNGHAPEHSLGERNAEGYQPGYAMNDTRVRRRMVELCAPMIGKATIEHIRFDTGNPREMILETGPGTSDRLMMQHKNSVMSALEAAGLTGPEISSMHAHSGEFVVHFTHEIARSHETLDKLSVAFETLRRGAPGLVISDALIKQDIETQRQLLPKTMVKKVARETEPPTARQR